MSLTESITPWNYPGIRCQQQDRPDPKKDEEAKRRIEEQQRRQEEREREQPRED